MNQDNQISAKGLAYLVTVYLIWGSTYLAIRFAVREGSGIPPFALGAMRTLIPGPALLALGIFPQDAALIDKIGVCDADSGGIAHVGRRKRTRQLGRSTRGLKLCSSSCGRPPDLDSSHRFVAAPTSTFLATARLPRHRIRWHWLTHCTQTASSRWGRSGDHTHVDRSSYHMVSGHAASDPSPGGCISARDVCLSSSIGGVGFVFFFLVTREPWPTPTAESWSALAHLFVAGSIIAFTAYVRTLHLLPTHIAMTYASVNPVVAVLLGWTFLNEDVSLIVLAGMALILLGVWGVFREKYPMARPSR